MNIVVAISSTHNITYGSGTNYSRITTEVNIYFFLCRREVGVRRVHSIHPTLPMDVSGVMQTGTLTLTGEVSMKLTISTVYIC